MPHLGNHVDAIFIPESVNTSTTLRINGGDLRLDDGKKALFGQGGDLQIYHNGDHSFIDDAGVGGLYIRGGGQIGFRDSENSFANFANFNSAGAVDLYYNGSKRFETTATGATVTGTALATVLSTGASGTGINISTSTITGPATLTIDPAAIGDDTGTVEIKGNLTVQGTTTTINSTTVDLDHLSLGDNEKANFGAGDDLQIYHDGSNSYIDDTGIGRLNIRGNTGVSLRNYSNSNQFINCYTDGTVELFFNNSKKFETTTTGVSVTGALEVSAAANITVGGTALPSLTNLLGGSLDGTLGSVTMAYLAAAPSSPVQGQFYFNSLSSKAQIYTGSAFVDLVPSGGGGGGGGGGSSSDANATFRKYTYSISSTTNSVTGSSDAVVTPGNFVIGLRYTIKTIGNTNFTSIGASASPSVGEVFTATGAGTSGETGEAYDTLIYSTGGDQNVEVYVNGVKAVEGATNDYVATSGTSVNFVANLASGDVVDIQVYELLTNDAFVLATGGTFSGNVGINTSTINNRLHIHSNANEQGILLTQEGNNYSVIYSDSNRTGVDSHLLAIEGHWNGTPVAEIALSTGSDTTNKDDGQIIFRTSSADNLTTSERMRIKPNGNVGIGTDNPSGKLEIKGSGGGTGLTFKGTDSSGNTNFWIMDGGKVGVHYSPFVINQDYNDTATPSSTYFYVHGSSPFIVKSDGSVGIGTDNPLGKLVVSDGANGLEFNPNSNNAIVSYNRSTSAYAPNGLQGSTVQLRIGGVGTALHVHSDGKVGIGETTPIGQLDIKGNVSSTTQFSGFDGLRIHNANGSAFGVTADMYFTAGTGSSNRGAAIGSELVSGYGNDLYFATNGGNVSSTNVLTERLRITSDRVRIYGESSFYTDIIGNSQTVTANVREAGCRFIGPEARRMYFELRGNDSTDHIRFITSPNNDMALDYVAMHIGNDGNVGINTDAPAAKLHINGGAANYTPNSSGTTLFKLTGGASSQYSMFIGIDNAGGYIGHNGNGRKLFLQTNETTRMTLDTSGNVGINDTGPTRTLSVNGNMNLASGSRIESYSSGGNLIIQGGSTWPGGHIQMYGGTGGDKITFNTTGGGSSTVREQMRINNSSIRIGGGSNTSNNGFVPLVFTSANLVGAYRHGNSTRFIGQISPCNVGNTYLHVKIDVPGGGMFWIHSWGYMYGQASFHNSQGVGYFYGSNIINTTVSHMNSNYPLHLYKTTDNELGLRIYAGHGASNAWGFHAFEGGHDGITGNQTNHFMRILAYTWSSSSANQY